jgi:hypothetical protein
MRRLLLILTLGLLAAVAAAPASAAPQMRGPAGLRVVRPPATVQCPPDRVTAWVRFTGASKKRGVRSARVDVRGTDARKTISAKRKGLRRVRLAVTCGRTFTLRITALGPKRKVLARKSFRVKARPAQSAPVGDLGAPPGAQTVAPGSATTWTAVVDARRSGPRDGQTCVQVSATTAGNVRTSDSTYCGLLTEDPFVARTRVLNDPAGGTPRLVLSGAANITTVAGVSVVTPAGTQPLPLSPEGTVPGSGGGFIAVWDAATTRVEDLTLVVTLATGAVQSHPAPRSLNLRSATGQRI